MKPVKAGRLRHRITIQTFATSQDEFGEQVRTPVPLAVRWASIEPLRGDEQFTAEQVQADVTHRVKVRDAAGATPKMQIVFGARTFEIQSVGNVEERDRLTEIMCKEQV